VTNISEALLATIGYSPIGLMEGQNAVNKDRVTRAKKMKIPDMFTTRGIFKVYSWL